MRTRGFFRCWMSALFGAKNFEFFELDGVSARTRGLNQCGQGGRGSIFRDFVRTSFMNGPLHVGILETKAGGSEPRVGIFSLVWSRQFIELGVGYKFSKSKSFRVRKVTLFENFGMNSWSQKHLERKVKSRVGRF